MPVRILITRDKMQATRGARRLMPLMRYVMPRNTSERVEAEDVIMAAVPHTLRARGDADSDATLMQMRLMPA